MTIELNDNEKEQIEEWKGKNARCEKHNGFQIKINVYGDYDEDDEEVIIDEESMREEFEEKMEFLLQMKLFSEEELKKWFSNDGFI